MRFKSFPFCFSYMVSVPKTTPQGYKIVIHALTDPDPAKFNHEDWLKAMFLFSDIRISEDELANGYIIICDTKGTSLSHMTKINFSLFRLSLKYVQVIFIILRNQNFSRETRTKNCHFTGSIADQTQRSSYY